MSDPVIQSVRARRVWDSRGRPTIEAEVALSDGALGRALRPPGPRAAAGRRWRSGTAGQSSAASTCRTRLRAFASRSPRLWPAPTRSIRQGSTRTLVALDGTANLSRLGGNALTAVSLAVLQAAAASQGLPLWRYLLGDGAALIPLPEIQIFGGGAHASRRTDVQDFMVMAPRAETFAQALEMTAEVYHAAGRVMAERGLLQGVADEGGWWPAFLGQ